jgi:hypothetical protein
VGRARDKARTAPNDREFDYFSAQGLGFFSAQGLGFASAILVR